MLHSFVGGSDGDPGASLIDVNGTLYGTTSVRRTVRRLGLQHQYFRHGARVARVQRPSRWAACLAYGLINVKGTLYGTTDYGGHAGCRPKLNQNLGCGTIFKIAL